MQQENNPKVDVIPDMDWGEYEQLQTQPPGDTEILEEQLHTEEDIQSQQHEEKEEQGSITQEPIASQPLAEIVADDQVENEIKIQEEVVPQEPTSSQSASKIAMREPQKEDDVTQEPASPRVVDIVAKESPEKVAITQEKAPLEIASYV